MKRKNFSPTFLKSVDECPYKAMNDTYSPSWAPLFGDAVHTVLYESVANGLDHIAALKELNRTLWTREFKGPNGATKMPYRKYSEKLSKIISNMEHLPDLRIGTEGWQVMDCESQGVPEEFKSNTHGKRFLAVPVLPDGSCLRGAIDRLDYNPELDAWRIVDYKTGISEPDDFQILTNALMIIYPYGIEMPRQRITGKYDCIETGKTLPVNIDSDILINHYNHINRLVSVVRSGIYVKKPSRKACLFCTVDCSEGKRYQMKG